MPVLLDPVPSRDRRLLREAVLDLATTEHRHHFPPVLHVGTPGGTDRHRDRRPRGGTTGCGPRWWAPCSGRSRTRAWVWVTRVGPLSLQDVDVAWLGPTVTAAHERGSDPAFVVVTRHGWRDPRSGVGQEWRRIRRR